MGRTLLSAFDVAVEFVGRCFVLNLRIQVKSGGQECPPHTFPEGKKFIFAALTLVGRQGYP